MGSRWKPCQYQSSHQCELIISGDFPYLRLYLSRVNSPAFVVYCDDQCGDITTMWPLNCLSWTNSTPAADNASATITSLFERTRVPFDVRCMKLASSK